MDITANSHTKFGVLLPMRVWAITISNLGCRFIFSDLDVGAHIFLENVPIEILNKSFESTQNKQQDGTKTTCTEV